MTGLTAKQEDGLLKCLLRVLTCHAGHGTCVQALQHASGFAWLLVRLQCRISAERC